MIKVLNISHSWRNLENLENIKMCSSFEASGIQNQTSQSSLKDRYFILLMLYETKWDPDSIRAHKREERVEVSVAHYIIVKLMVYIF